MVTFCKKLFASCSVAELVEFTVELELSDWFTDWIRTFWPTVPFMINEAIEDSVSYCK